jgi:ribulose 1,5-bisphosphate carboxylase large subunit-like protein
MNNQIKIISINKDDQYEIQMYNGKKFYFDFSIDHLISSKLSQEFIQEVLKELIENKCCSTKNIFGNSHNRMQHYSIAYKNEIMENNLIYGLFELIIENNIFCNLVDNSSIIEMKLPKTK